MNAALRPCIALLAVCPILAQTPALNVTVTQALVVSVPGVQQTQPPGPLPGNSIQMSVSGNGSSASLVCGPTSGHPPGVSGFEIRSQGFGSSFGGPPFVTGEIILQLTAPTPTPILVVAAGTQAGNAIFATTILDIDNDLIANHSWVSNPFVYTDEDGEFGLLVGPAGRSIRIAHSTGVSTWNSSVSNLLELTIYTAGSPLAPYGPGCVDLTWSRSPSGGANYHVAAGSNSLAFFAFGLNPQQTPLAIAPGCFQLTDVLFAIAALPSGGQATFAQPPLALPPGVHFLVQSVIVGGTGAVQTSNGLRMSGPT